MFPTTLEEAQGAYAAAKNLNAALKNFLKKEGRGGSQVVSFAKEFRNAVASGRPAAVSAFIEQNYTKRDPLFVGLIRYVHPQAVESIVLKVFETYAEDFNGTYSKGQDGVQVTDGNKFLEISKAVVSEIESGLVAAELPVSNFMKNSVMVCIFESDVLREVFAKL